MTDEIVHARDAVAIGAGIGLAEGARWRCDWRVYRWDVEQTARAAALCGRQPGPVEFARLGIRPYDTSKVAGNLLTTAGLNRLTALAIAAGGQGLTNTACRIGVGNGAGTAAIGDTDLSASAGSANRWFQAMAATYPQQANGVITLQSVFGTADGNFAWQEFGIDVGTPTVTSGNTVAALLFNHKTSIAQGTKASGQTWTATATITIS